ncbi:MAG: FtsH-binding integral membrane protein [Planctomycetota bacterium]|jgi:FtsH-binding integral membrane protein
MNNDSHSIDLESQGAYGQPRAVIDLSVEARAAFLVKVYTHVFGALAAFALIEVVLFQLKLAEPIYTAMMNLPWLLIIGAFMLLGNLATGVAHKAKSLQVQYLALLSYVLMQSLLFLPMLFYANEYAKRSSEGGVIASAGLVSLAGFAGLTAIGLFSRKNFTFLGAIVKWGFMVALVAIIAAAVFGFTLGTLFSVVMVALTGASIIYTTQAILREYPEDRYVGASLQLFAAVAMLFWYILRIFMSRD